MINRVQKSRKRSDYKVCPRCGASLDPGERCDCQKGAVIMSYIFDKERVEKTLQAFDEVWAKAKDLNREKIEGQLIGGTILGVYPLFDVEPDGSYTTVGLSIAVRPLKSRKVITVDVGSVYESSAVLMADGYTEPEEIAEMGL